ncbi:hypothetical protein CLF_104351 [Clonorchis sinensis]|uniref:Uncharacterized protein n=1 Tax=Clonorchis sinensis TaxID=79923 RepID=G7YBH0_CLOSI|nr:hypothetical protein CLF_104351 [Clonorchis sinensis]
MAKIELAGNKNDRVFVHNKRQDFIFNFVQEFLVQREVISPITTSEVRPIDLSAASQGLMVSRPVDHCKTTYSRIIISLSTFDPNDPVKSVAPRFEGWTSTCKRVIREPPIRRLHWSLSHTMSPFVDVHVKLQPENPRCRTLVDAVVTFALCPSQLRPVTYIYLTPTSSLFLGLWIQCSVRYVEILGIHIWLKYSLISLILLSFIELRVIHTALNAQTADKPPSIQDFSDLCLFGNALLEIIDRTSSITLSGFKITLATESTQIPEVMTIGTWLAPDVFDTEDELAFRKMRNRCKSEIRQWNIRKQGTILDLAQKNRDVPFKYMRHRHNNKPSAFSSTDRNGEPTSDAIMVPDVYREHYASLFAVLTSSAHPRVSRSICKRPLTELVFTVEDIRRRSTHSARWSLKKCTQGS